MLTATRADEKRGDAAIRRDDTDRAKRRADANLRTAQEDLAACFEGQSGADFPPRDRVGKLVERDHLRADMASADRDRQKARDGLDADLFDEELDRMPDATRAAELELVLKDSQDTRDTARDAQREAGLSCLLHRLTGSEDIVFGTPHVMRPDADLWAEFGYFGNTLALRTEVKETDPFLDVFARARGTIFEAFLHQEVAFEEVVEALGVKPSNHSPVFQVLLVMHAYFDTRAIEMGEIHLDFLGDPPAIAKYDLTLDINPGPEGVVISIEYANDLFDHETVERFGVLYRHLLLSALAAPETSVGELALLADDERELVVSGFNATSAAYPGEETVVSLFARQATQTPDKTAVIDGDRRLTYGELDRLSNQLARHLIALGVGPEVVVGVCLERSAELIVSLLGILKAGGAYLPLDPDYPVDRLEFMITDAGAPLVVTTEALGGRIAFPGGRLVFYDAVALTDLPDDPVADAERLTPLHPGTLAYVIYTSGSTGKPKGVCVPHSNIARLCRTMGHFYQIGSEDNVLQFASLAFAQVVEEVFPSLVSGASVVIFRHGESELADDLAHLTKRNAISVAMVTPSLLRELPLHAFGNVDRLIVTGEMLPKNLAVAWAEGRTLFNEYGSTETTICATAFLVPPAFAGDIVPIGSPIPGTQAYVVDARFEPQPVGVAGELLIGGVQVARGYLGRPDLTAERFIADPFSGEPGARLYRTGDLARWRSDGTLEFLGRRDFQVKIRGMRVELGEVEAALGACAGIAQSVVVARPDAEGETRLVAYVVPEDLADAVPEADRPGVEVVELVGLVDLEAVRSALQRILPDHMVPSGYVGLSRLPLTASEVCGQITTFDAQFLHADLMDAGAAALISAAVRRWMDDNGCLTSAPMGPNRSI